jgi:FtsZ-interacting cell division protein ZipA
MDTWVVVLIVLAILIVLGLVLMAARQRRSQALKERFGPEYERAVETTGDRRDAERELREREERRQKLEIRELDPAARERYIATWRETQARFVDQPQQAVQEADALVILVMRDRGYPVDDFDQRSADIAVDHPDVVANYRAAHDISIANERGTASTEDLRQAMVHYRALFEHLLGAPDGAARDVDLREERDTRRL